MSIWKVPGNNRNSTGKVIGVNQERNVKVHRKYSESAGNDPRKQTF